MEHTGQHQPIGRRYRSAFLERISYIHPTLPFFVWAPIVLGSLWLGWRAEIAPLAFAAWAAAGWFFWTLAEYALHRWVFHWEPRNPRLNRLLRPIHKVHHEVIEFDRVVAHPMFSLPLGLAFFGVFWLLPGPPAVFPFYAGFTVGYLTYELIHFRTHFGKARTGLARKLRKRHLQHHHACPARWFGVSTALWDYVFRTHVPRGQRPAGMS